MVASQFLMDGDTNHITNTIIGGSQFSDPDSSSVVYFISGEDTTSVLCGFTITGGKGTTDYNPDIWLLARVGGGIWISGSGANIRNNIITRNRCEDILLPNILQDWGGGICSDVDQDDFWIVIENNVIDSNYVISDSSTGVCIGGGMVINNNCRIINNIIKNNVAKNLVNTIYSSQGGGMVVSLMDTAWLKKAIIQNNLIENNLVKANNAYAGGLLTSGMQIIVSNNLIKTNRAEKNVWENDIQGGGLFLISPFEGSVFRNNIVEGNFSDGSAGGLTLSSGLGPSSPQILVENNYILGNHSIRAGGAFRVWDCPVLFQNNIFKGNEAIDFGIGTIDWSIAQIDDEVQFVNNTFSENNTTNVLSASIRAKRSHVLFLNCIFWGNLYNTPHEIITSNNAEIEIAYSDIDTNAINGTMILGKGIINEDPLFSEIELLATKPWSPCVDKGTVNYLCNCGDIQNCPSFDITGTLRPVGNGIDMGAYDIKASGEGIGRITDYGLRITNWPNPFIEHTTFSFPLNESSRVILQIYDSFGQLVAEPLNTIQSKGEHHVIWNAGNEPAGMYYYRIQAGSKIGSGKIIKW